MSKYLTCAALAATSLLAGAQIAAASIIDFSSGTAFLNSGASVPVTALTNVDNVDYYEVDGFRIDFTFAVASPTPFSSNVGDYYGVDNGVIHAHWATGDFGSVTEIMFSRIDGLPFDLNYFVLTSNTSVGGGLATGTEQTFIHSSTGFSQMLPPEDWGFPAVPVFLGTEFDDVTFFRFTALTDVDCFGMDNFFIDEEAPGTVPEPTTLALVGSGILGALVMRRRRRQ